MMDTLTQVERLIELAIIQRSELRRLVEELPQLKAHLSEEIERTFEETEPQLRAELEEWTTKQTADKTAALGVALEAKIADLAKSLEVSTQARYNAIIAERAENARLAAQAEAKIAEHAASLPGAVKEIVSAELARFPRAGEIDQLRKEFAEPKSLNPRGKWQAGETYNKLDLVTINGDSYVSNIDGNSEKPSRSAANWTLNAARGISGGGGGITSLNDILGNPSTGDIVGSEGNNYVRKTLTAGTGITITDDPSTITIDASGAQEMLTATVKNAESVAITRGQVVYLFGATGNMASVKLASNTSDATSAKTFGVVSDASIAPNGTGTITCVGVQDKLMLGAFNEGDTLYLGATAGSVTNVKPYAPNHLVYVGIVERANNGNGELYVKIQNGYELDEIHDVQINSPRLAGQTLIYDQTNDLWKNARLTGTANQITVTNADAAVTLSIPTNPTLAGNLTVSGDVLLPTNSAYRLNGKIALLYNGSNLYIEPNNDLGNIIIGASAQTTFGFTVGGNLTVSGTGTFSGTGSFVNTLTVDRPNGGDAMQVNASTLGVGSTINHRFGKIGTAGDSANFSFTYQGANSASNQFGIGFYGAAPVFTLNNSTGNATLTGNLTVSGTGGVSATAGILRSAASGSASSGSGVEIGGGATPLLLAYNRTTPGYLPMRYHGSSHQLSVPGVCDVTLNASGNFLIGTTTDGGQKLQVAGSGIFSTTEPVVTLASTAVGNIAYQLISGGGSGHALGAFKIYDSSTGYVVLNHDKPTSGGTRLSFDGAGNATFAATVTGSGGFVGTDNASNNAYLFLARSDVSFSIANETSLRIYSKAGRTNNAASGGVKLLEIANTSGDATFAGNASISKANPELAIRSASDAAGQIQYLTFGSPLYNRAQFRVTSAGTSDGSIALYTFNAASPILSQTWTKEGNVTLTGTLGVGTSASGTFGIYVTNSITNDGAAGVNSQPTVSASGGSAYAYYGSPLVSTNSMGAAYVMRGQIRTAASAITLSNAYGYFAAAPTLGATSAITYSYGAYIENQGKTGITHAYGINIEAQSGAATTNIGLRNLGATVLATPAAAVTLADNSTMTFELTSNTSLTIKVRGTDGTTRSVALTLA